MGYLTQLFSGRSSPPPAAEVQTAPPPTEERQFRYIQTFGGLQNADKFVEWLQGNSYSVAGMSISPEAAMRASAVYSAVRLISNTLAFCPLNVYKNLDNGGKEVVRDHPLQDILRKLWNREHTAFEGKGYHQSQLLLEGTTVAQKIRNGLNEPAELIPLQFFRCQIRFDRQFGEYVVDYYDDDGTKTTFRRDKVLIIRGLVLDGGAEGNSPIRTCLNAIGLSLALENHGASLFGKAARPDFIVETDKTLSDGAHERLQKDLQAKFSGPQNSHNIAVFEEGMKWSKISMNNEESQFLETRKFQIAEVARIFNIPAHLLGDLENATFSNIEQQFGEFLQMTMPPWFEAWSQSLERDMLTEKERRKLSIDFDAQSLIEGDRQVLSQLLTAGINGGWYNVNDCRAKLHENPVPGGDVYRSPLNLGNPGGNPEDTKKDNNSPPADTKGTEKPKKDEKKSINSEVWKAHFSRCLGRICRKEATAIAKQTRKLGNGLTLTQLKDWRGTFHSELKPEIREEAAALIKVFAALNPEMSVNGELVAEAFSIATLQRSTNDFYKALEAENLSDTIAQVEAVTEKWLHFRADQAGEQLLSLLIGEQ